MARRWTRVSAVAALSVGAVLVSGCATSVVGSAAVPSGVVASEPTGATPTTSGAASGAISSRSPLPTSIFAETTASTSAVVPVPSAIDVTTTAPPSPPATPAVGPTTAATTSDSGSVQAPPNAMSQVTSDPTDLLWSVLALPAGWRQLDSARGTQRMDVPGGCSVLLDQPQGLKKAGVDATGVITKYVHDLGASQSGDPTPTALNTDGREFPLTRTSPAGPTAVMFTGSRVHFAESGITAQLYAYVAGDFALVFQASCGDASVAVLDGSIATYLGGLQVDLSY